MACRPKFSRTSLEKKEQVIGLLIAGKSLVQIQETANIDVRTIWKLLGDEQFQEELVQRQRTAFGAVTGKAIQTLIGCLDSQNETVRLKAALEILDRTGYGGEQVLRAKIEKNTINITITGDSDAEN